MKELLQILTAAAVVEFVFCRNTRRLVVRGTNGAQGVTCRRIWVN